MGALKFRNPLGFKVICNRLKSKKLFVSSWNSFEYAVFSKSNYTELSGVSMYLVEISAEMVNLQYYSQVTLAWIVYFLYSKLLLVKKQESSPSVVSHYLSGFYAPS